MTQCAGMGMWAKLCLSVGKPWRYNGKRRMCLFKERLERMWISFTQNGSALFTQTACMTVMGRGAPREIHFRTDWLQKLPPDPKQNANISTPPTFLPPPLGSVPDRLRGHSRAGTVAPGQRQSHACAEPAQGCPPSHVASDDVDTVRVSFKCRACCSQVLQNQLAPFAWFSWFLNFVYMQKAKITVLIGIIPKPNERMLVLAKYRSLKVIQLSSTAPH